MEPVPGMIGTIRELCDREGMLMIADETITGFRFGPGGAQKHLGFTPDLTILGKAIGGGVPFAALAGRKFAMEKIIAGAVVHAGPVTLEVELLRRSDGEFELEDKQSHLASMCGDRFDMGPCAVVRHGGLTILLTSGSTPPFDLGQWRSQGIKPEALSVLAVKAAVAHRRAYDPIAARMLWVETPGPCTGHLRSLPYRKIQRPIFPLDG